MKKALLYLLVLCAALALAPLAEAAYYDENSGNSEADAYLIESPDDWNTMRVHAALDGAGKYYKLSADLSLSTGTNGWLDIAVTEFNGHFDGDNRTIQIDVDGDSAASSSTGALGALFLSLGNTDSSATIENLKVTGTIKGSHVASLVYMMYGGTIDNCSFTGTIEGTLYEISGTTGSTGTSVGGLVHSLASGTIKNCTFSGTIKATDTASNHWVNAGGIVESLGYNAGVEGECRVENCQVLANSTVSASSAAYSAAGGIAAAMTRGYVTGCSTSNVTVSGTYPPAGGIVGVLYDDSIRSSNITGNTWDTNAYPEVGSDSSGNGGGSSDSDSDSEPYTPNTNTLELELAPLDSEFEAWLADPEGYYEGYEFYGALPSPFNLSHLSDNPPASQTSLADDLPSRFDQRDVLPEVRNQNPYSTCWAHAALGAMEANYIKKGLGSDIDLSELHVSWFTYRDPQSGHAFPLYNSNNAVLAQGAWAHHPIAFLARLAGPTAEANLPYSDAGSVETVVGSRKPEDYPRSLRLMEVYELSTRDDNEEDRALIKRMIQAHGNVTASYNCNSSAYANAAYYLAEKEQNTHTVVLVGWDDDYESLNFPEGSKGAWLVRNSVGKRADLDEGYFWMSYEQALKDGKAYVVAANDANLRYYGWDDLGEVGRVNCPWSASVFCAGEDSETLREVAFYTTDNNAEYEVYVNVLGTTKPTTPGALGTAAAKGVMPNAGYHTIQLANPVSLQKGQYFSVIVKMTTGYGFPTAVEAPCDYAKTAVVNEGESYFSRDGATWADGVRTSAVAKDHNDQKTDKANACIKAFTTVPSSGGGNGGNGSNGDTPTSSSGGGGGGGCSTSGLGLLALAAAALLLRRR